MQSKSNTRILKDMRIMYTFIKLKARNNNNKKNKNNNNKDQINVKVTMN